MTALAGLLAALAVAAPRARAADPPPGGPPLTPVHAEPWSYVAPPLEGHCLQTFRLYLPEGDPPPDGWPALVVLANSAYKESVDTQEITSESLLYDVVGAGIAVVAARSTVSRTLDDPWWIEACGEAPAIPGHGLFKPPGAVPPDLLDAGTAPYDEPAYAMPEKDAVLVLQHVRHLAGQQAPFDLPGFPVEQQQALATLDPARLAAFGRSAGANSIFWTAVGPERSLQAPFAGLGGQYDVPARPAALALDVPAVWWPVFSGELIGTALHFGREGHSEFTAGVLGDSLLSERVALSPLHYADDGRVAALPVYLAYDEPSVVQDVTPGGGCGLEWCFAKQGSEGLQDGVQMVHAAWSGYAWKRLHPGRTRLAIEDGQAWAQRKGSVTATAFLGDDAGAARVADLVGWLQDVLAEPAAWPDDLDAFLVPGDRVRGSLLPQRPAHRFAFEGLAGQRLVVRARRAGGALEPALRLRGPQGDVLVDLADSVASPKAARVALDLPETGVYELELVDLGGEGGGAYRLTTRGSRRVKVQAEVFVPAEGGAVVPFAAVAGAEVCRALVQRTVPADPAPATASEAAAFEPAVEAIDAGGAFAVPLDGLVTATQGGRRVVLDPFELPYAGAWSLRVGSAAGGPGWATARVVLRLPRGRRELQLDG